MEQKDFLLFAGVLIGIILVASLLTYVTANAISLNPRYTFASCTDSDGGKDVYVKGNVTQGRKKIVDSCFFMNFQNTVSDLFHASCTQ